MSRVAVKEDVLRWAVDRSGLTLEGLQNRFPRIQDWAIGASQPTLRQLEDLAKATLTPFGFFFLDRPPDERLPIPHFRTVRADSPDKPSPELMETVHTMQRRQEWMRDYLIDQGNDPLSIVRSANIREQTAAVAEKIRQALGFEDEWASAHRSWTDALTALREGTETLGVLVAVNGVVGNNTHRKLDVDEFRGFVLVDDFAPLVFVNGADGKAAQMFTLAHELAHVFFGSSAAFDLRRLQPADDATERACNMAAAEFLVPESSLREMWPIAVDSPNCFQILARKFKVSELVIARRALDLGFINRDDFFAFYQNYLDSLRERPKATGGGFYATQNFRLGKRFARAVVQATRDGSLLYNEAYRLTGLHGKTFEQYAERLGYGASL